MKSTRSTYLELPKTSTSSPTIPYTGHTSSLSSGSGGLGERAIIFDCVGMMEVTDRVFRRAAKRVASMDSVSVEPRNG